MGGPQIDAGVKVNTILYQTLKCDTMKGPQTDVSVKVNNILYHNKTEKV